jgi:hypothetical protein
MRYVHPDEADVLEIESAVPADFLQHSHVLRAPASLGQESVTIMPNSAFLGRRRGHEGRGGGAER